MLVYLFRRLINVVLMLLVVAAVTFGIFFMVPKLTGTDPALLYVGKIADKVAVEGIRHKMGLDKSIVEQFWLFLKGIVVGRSYNAGTDVTHCYAPCLGYSFKTEREVWPLLLDRVGVDFSLAIGASILWLVLGTATGIVSALRRGTALDRISMSVALAGVSLPMYFTGLVSLAIFVGQLGWFPRKYTDFTADPVAWFQGLVLPWVTLAFLFAATYARLSRATLLDVLGEDYIRTARAKGLREPVVIGKHALRSTLTPILTIFGMDLGGLLGGAVLTENTFNLRGLGYEAVQSIASSDLPVIMGVTLFAAFFIVIANLLVDLLYAVVDPRVKLA
ncbi:MULTISPECIES: ABC transporter permease [Kitasatospora]|uniref:ABC transporter permease n=1 Tax=Kitasatospora griseola TaxID=2064 RepID=A0A0D0PTL9_KITGR|nr:MULTISPECIES: ABC transporter permease [Kitasatospora]KIQ63727.1 ABC transporter permease [Kitasatospora griseola]PJN23428.1 ABC transporter permease [Kitasatospora sp. CB02891]GGQ55744.1 ABC transporter permease [Kitasatospora griseola]